MSATMRTVGSPRVMLVHGAFADASRRSTCHSRSSSGDKDGETQVSYTPPAELAARDDLEDGAPPLRSRN
jgi:hypothetical protein